MNRSDKNTWLQKLGLFAAMVVAFLGGMIGIMNFHSDVDMPKTHQVIYRIVTGEQSDRPLVVSIPYTVGLGVGFWLLLPDSNNKQTKGVQTNQEGTNT